MAQVNHIERYPSSRLDTNAFAKVVGMEGSVVEMISRIEGSIVRISVAKRLPDGEFEESHGSGFVTQVEGEEGTLVVTNAHVIGASEGSDHELFFGSRGNRMDGVELVGWHPWVDIAVLRARIESPPDPLPFRNELARMGEDCLVLGFPWRVDLSVSRGIVSGLDRDTEMGKLRLPIPWLQSDVSINEGNSGGPMVDLKGEVIGVASMSITAPRLEPVVSEDRGREVIKRKVAGVGLNLFIPTEIARSAVEAVLAQDGEGVPVGDEGIRFDRGFWSNFVWKPNIPSLRDRPGVVAIEVVEGSPASEAGIRPEDSIIRIDGVEVDHPADLLAWRVKSESWREGAKVTVWREGKELEVLVRAEESRLDPADYEYRLE